MEKKRDTSMLLWSIYAHFRHPFLISLLSTRNSASESFVCVVMVHTSKASVRYDHIKSQCSMGSCVNSHVQSHQKMLVCL